MITTEPEKVRLSQEPFCRGTGGSHAQARRTVCLGQAQDPSCPPPGPSMLSTHTPLQLHIEASTQVGCSASAPTASVCMGSHSEQLALVGLSGGRMTMAECLTTSAFSQMHLTNLAAGAREHPLTPSQGPCETCGMYGSHFPSSFRVLLALKHGSRSPQARGPTFSQAHC